MGYDCQSAGVVQQLIIEHYKEWCLAVIHRMYYFKMIEICIRREYTKYGQQKDHSGQAGKPSPW